jgi:RHS repeat-associated protein
MSTLNNRPRDDGTRDIEHTVYEPNSFTPLVRLSTTAQGNPQTQPHLLVQMTKAGTPADKRDSSGNLRSLEMMQSMMAAMPPNMQKEMEKGMKHMLEKGPTPLGRTIMSNMGIDPDSFIGGIREGIKQIEQEKQTPVEIHFYHCDHLGTPIALTDRNGKIVWAARYDPWGNIEEEFNPYNIEQNIRLPGQHHDRETGLYYNRHRYYDPKIGAYINQDPIGLGGGVNLSAYVLNPMSEVDPLGLAECTFTLSAERLVCVPANSQNSPVNIPAASGNNAATDAQGKPCRNNPNCTSIPNRGPIPLGDWRWTNGWTGTQNGRVLEPVPGTNTNVTENRTNIRSHSCVNPFGPGLGPQFCSEGCVTGTVSDIQDLNRLIDAEPGSTLKVVP